MNQNSKILQFIHLVQSIIQTSVTGVVEFQPHSVGQLDKILSAQKM